MSYESIEEQSITSFTREAYLNYSMYVILDRALPYIADGLKPVQRRIIYAMSEIGLSSISKPKKSARTVGDVLGKFHPHGDSACYEAMVLMAQDFSYRYPMISGQGNWGSVDDPKSFAAMRYTESKLSKYADLLLNDLKQGTVSWIDNFDGTLKEPSYLPAKVPNILLNGSSGIAVGMSTDIPSHNITEVINGCISLLKKPTLSISELMEIIPAPDFPGGCEIVSSYLDRKHAYETGNGSLKLRAIYNIENTDIIISKLPHQVSSSKIIEQIALQMRNKKLPWIMDLRDESDFEHNIRIVLSLKSNRVDISRIMSHLFATTDLEKNYRINFNIIGLNGKPKVFSLIEILSCWLKYRKETIIKKIEFRLGKINEQLHILEGYMLAFLNVDKVIHIIRTEDHPKVTLIDKFNISNIQAEAILNLKLRYLAKLEEFKIRKEIELLSKDREYFISLLGSKVKLKNFMVKELTKISQDYADDRRSPVSEKPVSVAITEEELIPVENVTVMLSVQGWLKCAKGHKLNLDTQVFKTGDKLCDFSEGKSTDNTLLFDTKGKVYTMITSQLPSGRGNGEPVTGKLKLAPGASVNYVITATKEDSVVFVSSFGIGFISNVNYIATKNKGGKSIVNISDEAELLSPLRLPSQYLTGFNKNIFIVLITSQGRCLLVNLGELPRLNKGRGSKLINIPQQGATGEYLKHAEILMEGHVLLVYAGKRHMKISQKDLEIYKGKRGVRGVLLPRGFQSVRALKIIN